MAPPPLICVIHGCKVSGNQPILEELLGLIEASGLRAALTACVVNTIGDRVTRYETVTIPILRSLALLHPTACVLYLHTKGVRRHGHAVEWRRYMTYFLVERWRETIDRLQEPVDAVGCDLLGSGAGRHFSGNFWWARAAYLARRPPAPTTGDRHLACERWLLTAEATALSLHQSGNDHYRQPYPRSAYALD
jgi:hypothetical protein